MNAMLRFEALGESDGAYVEQAAQYRGIAARRTLMKRGALAACHCLLAACVIAAQAAAPCARNAASDLRAEWDVALFGARCDLGL